MNQNIQHHLSDALLMAYSAGTLPEAFNLTVATHIAMCDECRARLGAFDSVGGALMESCEAVPMAEDSLAATLALIGGARPERPAGRRAHDGAKQLFPQPLRDYIGGDLDEVRWRSVGMGVKQAVIPTAGDATARLLYIPAGASVPDHGHGGTELTLVLQGAFEDDGARFAAGDIEIADEDLHHTPVAAANEDCICLAATDAPLQFRGIVPRLAQSFMNI